ncbi:hypothetical protein CWI38_1194p0010 [Hamiltosporidium tvaerminnensis]|uniref:Leucine-rich repeat-containing protein n=1 Tax=Hamiltosporidium tvaerminnensis TaxID=1176355 RepID=A0A4V2JXE0_9MICR|nr:hypothetical protein CWI38_1194p0010 [Hamiltosporidium tvaerminnensis]
MKRNIIGGIYFIAFLLIGYFDLYSGLEITFRFPDDICEAKCVSGDRRNSDATNDAENNILLPHGGKTDMNKQSKNNINTNICNSIVINDIGIYPIKFEAFLLLENHPNLHILFVLDHVQSSEFRIFDGLMRSYIGYTEKISSRTLLNIFYILNNLKPVRCPIFYQIINILLLNFDSNMNQKENDHFLTKELCVISTKDISFDMVRIFFNQFFHLYISDAQMSNIFSFEMLSDISPTEHESICDGTEKRILSLDHRFLIYFKEDIYSSINRLQLFNTILLLFKIQCIHILYLNEDNLSRFKIFFELILNEIEIIIFKNIEYSINIEIFIVDLLKRINVKQIYFIDPLFEKSILNTQMYAIKPEKIIFLNFVNRESCESFINTPSPSLDNIQRYMMEKFDLDFVKLESSDLENRLQSPKYNLANYNGFKEIYKPESVKQKFELYTFFNYTFPSCEISGLLSDDNSLKNIKIIFSNIFILNIEKFKIFSLENLTSMQLSQCNLSLKALVSIINLPNIKNLEIKKSEIIIPNFKFQYYKTKKSLISLNFIKVKVNSSIFFYNIVNSLNILKNLQLKLLNITSNISKEVILPGKLTKLRSLYLSSYELLKLDKFLLPNLEIIEEITLKNISLNSPGPNNYGILNIKNTKSVTLKSCQINSSEKHFFDLSIIQKLKINACCFVNISLYEIFVQDNFYAIESFELTKIQITENDVSTFALFVNLRYLFIYYCDFIDNAILGIKKEKYANLILFELKYYEEQINFTCILHLQKEFEKHLIIDSSTDLNN